MKKQVWGPPRWAELFTHNRSQSPQEAESARGVRPRESLTAVEPTNGVEPLTC